MSTPMREKRCETCHWCEPAVNAYSPFRERSCHFSWDDAIERERPHFRWYSPPGAEVTYRCVAMAPLHKFDVQATDWCGQWTKMDEADKTLRAGIEAERLRLIAEGQAIYDADLADYNAAMDAWQVKRDTANVFKTLGLRADGSEEPRHRVPEWYPPPKPKPWWHMVAD